jgi:hypothetical protein
VERRSGLREFTNSGIREKEKETRESSEAQDQETSWPMVIVHGYIKEEAYHRDLVVLALRIKKR